MRVPRTLSREAYTYVEMLVVFGVASLILALVGVTVMRFRETANRVICRNNLRQMGVGFLSHNDVHDAFPSGGTFWNDTLRVWKDGSNNTVPAVFDTQSWGWGYQLLPYIGRRDIWANPNDNLVGDNPIVEYHCPSARPYARFWYAQAGGACFRYMWEYSGNGGSWGVWDDLTYGRNSLDGAIVPSVRRTIPGASSSGRIVNSGNLKDGASNVLLIGEKYLDVTARNLQPICSDDQGWLDGWDNDAIAYCRGGSSGNPPTSPRQFDNNVGCGLYFGSSHLAMQCVFCDGSTHSVAYDIDPLVWLALCSSTDGTPSTYKGID